MGIKYLIAHQVVYTPGSHTLRLVNTGSTTLLATPASLCLQLLLERHGDVVTQADFLEKVWRARGMNVSQGTIYQNISLLRKSIDGIGGGSDVIKTISKKGFSISSLVSVSVIRESDNILLPATKEKENPQINIVEISSPTDEISIQEVFSPNEINDIVVAENKNKIIKYHYILTFSLIICLLFAVISSSYLLFTTFHNKRSYYDGFLAKNDYKNCHVYINSNAEDESIHLKAIDTIQPDCNIYPYVYVSAFKIITAASVVACTQNFKQANNGEMRCASYFYRVVK